MKILFIACYSPYINNSAAIECLQYLNKLSELKGNKVHLLTVKFPEDSIYFDKKLLKLLSDKVKVTQVDGGKLFNALVPRRKANSGGMNVNISGGKVRNILRNIKNMFVIPDMYYAWSKKASVIGKEIVKNEKIDVIFSMHEPPSSHLCAYRIKKEFKSIPWITYWSDPWLKDSTKENAFFLKKIIEKGMEKDIIELADKYIFVTEANRNDYISTYSIDKNKTEIITRGFDKELFSRIKSLEKPALIKEDKINIIYAGEIFSKLRNINPFIDAINNLKSTNNELYSKMNILFFGNIDDVEARERLRKIDVVTLSSRIPFEEALLYMLNSDILLLFGNKNSKQIPAKIYEYFGATGKIFVIYGDENDPIRPIVHNNSKCITSLNNNKEIEEKLVRLLKTDKGSLLEEPDFNYEWDSIITRLNKVLEV